MNSNYVYPHNSQLSYKSVPYLCNAKEENVFLSNVSDGLMNLIYLLRVYVCT